VTAVQGFVHPILGEEIRAGDAGRDRRGRDVAANSAGENWLLEPRGGRA
jgi:hypothetical protein